MTKITPTTPQDWTRENLETALNTAIAVELFTIPVYLSAATSIIKENRGDPSITATLEGETPETTRTENFSAYDVIMSVAIQEMYHLTLACNITNAMGIRPTITAPDLENPPSCLSSIKGLPVKGNLTTLIDTMLAIEAPDPNYSYDESPLDPVSTKGPTKYQEEYDSIGDLYHALAYGVQKFWNYNEKNDEYQKLNFKGKYPDVKQDIQTLNEAWNAMACIVEEGEGNGADGFMPDAYVPAEGQEYHDLDEISHWERFNDIKTYITNGGIIPQYQANDDMIVDTAQDELTETYSKVINQMAEDFTKPNGKLNLRGMSETGSLSTKVWLEGKAPQWTYIPKPTPWQPIPKDAHVCQGLNMCKGQGAGKTGTGAGDGSCATVEQACSTSNECKGLGACGYAAAGQIPTPGQNNCSGLGGCQSPVSPRQYYSAKTEKYGNSYVWDVARKLFKDKYGKSNPGKTLKPVGAVSSARLAVEPTSPK